MKLKKCSVCGEEKYTSLFPRRKDKKLYNYCNDCMAVKVAERNAKNYNATTSESTNHREGRYRPIRRDTAYDIFGSTLKVGDVFTTKGRMYTIKEKYLRGALCEFLAGGKHLTEFFVYHELYKVIALGVKKELEEELD